MVSQQVKGKLSLGANLDLHHTLIPLQWAFPHWNALNKQIDKTSKGISCAGKSCKSSWPGTSK